MNPEQVLAKEIKRAPATTLRKLRDYFELTQEQLAAALETSFVTVSNHERGVRKPNPLYIKSYANFYVSRIALETEETQDFLKKLLTTS
jgi:predicted transcriptional regulator